MSTFAVCSRLWCQCSAGQDNRKAEHIHWHAILVLCLTFVVCT